MRRRSLLAALPAAVTLTGCSALQSPDVRFTGGVGVLTPADPIQIANGLQPNGDDSVYAVVVPDEAPDLITDGTDSSLVDRLQNGAGDKFHLVTQIRSTPEAPISMRVETLGDVRVDGDTLRTSVTVEPWGSLDRIDDEAQRERLREADELLYTSVWSLEPNLDSLPQQVELRLHHRNAR